MERYLDQIPTKCLLIALFNCNEGKHRNDFELASHILAEFSHRRIGYELIFTMMDNMGLHF